MSVDQGKVLRDVRTQKCLELVEQLTADARHVLGSDAEASVDAEAIANLQVASSILDAVVRVALQE